MITHAERPLSRAVSLLAVLAMAMTFLVAGPTTADAHDTSCVPQPGMVAMLSDVLAFANVFSTFVHTDSAECLTKEDGGEAVMGRDWGNNKKPGTFAPCIEGMAADFFPCDGIDLMSHVSMTELGLGQGEIPAGVNDIWGWTDDGVRGQARDYALLGSDEGTVFVDITDNKRPVVLGMLPTASTIGSAGWRDIKVYEDHAYVVSEHTNHGVQVFDLTRLRDWDGEYTIYDMDAHYTAMGSAHNIAINEDTGFAYALGSGDFFSQGQPHTVSVDGGGSYLASGASFGPRPTEAGLDAPFFDTGITACNDEVLPDLTGTIALIDRGGCFFSDKVANAELAGAAAVIIVSTADGYLTMAAGDERGDTITIPSVLVPSSAGAALRAELPGNGSIFANDPPPVCGDGLHMIDISSPKNPTFAGCESETDYVHDTQCVVYDGPDADYHGREICFNSNGIAGTFNPDFNKFSIVDVTDKSNPVVLSRVSYEGSVYSHQGWLTEDHEFFLFGDELDEVGYGVGTTTRVWDVSDLENPFVANLFENTTTAIDHNIYVQGDYAYASNYTSGLRVYDASDPANGLEEVAWFDMYPENDDVSFGGGTWSNYPYFHQKGIVAVSSVDRGLFILRPRVDRSGN